MEFKKFFLSEHLNSQAEIDNYLSEVRKEDCSPKTIAYAFQQAEIAQVRLNKTLSNKQTA